jgi:hypothetical protein
MANDPTHPATKVMCQGALAVLRVKMSNSSDGRYVVYVVVETTAAKLAG